MFCKENTAYIVCTKFYIMYFLNGKAPANDNKENFIKIIATIKYPNRGWLSAYIQKKRLMRFLYQ